MVGPQVQRFRSSSITQTLKVSFRRNVTFPDIVANQYYTGKLPCIRLNSILNMLDLFSPRLLTGVKFSTLGVLLSNRRSLRKLYCASKYLYDLTAVKNLLIYMVRYGIYHHWNEILRRESAPNELEYLLVQLPSWAKSVMPLFLGKQPEGPSSGTSHTVTTTSPKVTKKRLGIPVLHCNRQNASSFAKGPQCQCWRAMTATSPFCRQAPYLLLNIGFITSVGVQVCDRRPSVRRVLWLTMHNKLLQD
jgi:hypothetical protein